MAVNGLNRYRKEAELFRRLLAGWQNIIEISEELHQISINEELKVVIRGAVESTRGTQRMIISYLKQSDAMFEKLDTALGEFPTNETKGT